MHILASLAILNLITSSLLFFLYKLGQVIAHLTRQLFCCVLRKIILCGANSFSALMKLSTLNPNMYDTAGKCRFTLPSTLQFSQHYHSL